MRVIYTIGTFVFDEVVRWYESGEVGNYTWHKISAIFPSTYQKLLKLIYIWRSSDKNNFAQFLLRHPVYEDVGRVEPAKFRGLTAMSQKLKKIFNDLNNC